MTTDSMESKLRPNCLNFVELLAQNIALISPTMTAALIVPLMFSNTGNVSWLSYAVGTLMLLFVAFNLNQFAKRTTNAGSMYSYAISGLGYSGGAICGWCLVWAYLFIGLAGTTGFAIFAQKLLDMVHVTVPPVILFAACIGTSFVLAYKDIRISTLVMLGLEAFSCFFILVPLPDCASGTTRRPTRRNSASAACRCRAWGWASWWPSSVSSGSRARRPSARSR